MIDVLKRRKQIEGYLTNLDVTRVEGDAPIVINDSPVQQKTITQDNKTGQTKPVLLEEKKKLFSPKR